MSTLTIKRELEITDLDDLLWGRAKELWLAANDYTRSKVWETLLDIYQYNEEELPDITEINDFLWFKCDDLWEDEGDIA